MRVVLCLVVVACSSGGRHPAPAPQRVVATDPTTPADPDCARLAPADCVELGRSYRRGTETHAKDPAHALRIYTAACDRGNAEACAQLAVHVEDAEPARARQLYERACDGGDGFACTTLGFTHEESDPPRALAMFTRACAVAYTSGCAMVGKLAPDPAVRAAALRAACLAGPGEEVSCRGLIAMYTRGEVVRAPAQITAGLEALCGEEIAAACVAASLRHLSGEGVPKSGAQADRWLAAACTVGDLSICVSIGRRILLEATSDTGSQRAIPWLTKACDGGEAAGCEWLERARRPRR